MYTIISKILGDVMGSLRFKWQGLMFAWIACVLGWLGVAIIPNNYESKAVLYIDTATVLRPLLADLAVNTNVMSEVRMMTEVLLSRPQLERVARETDLDLRASNAEEMDKLIDELRRRVTVAGGAVPNPLAEQNMYTISYTDPEPDMVYAVVQSLVNFFVDRSLDENKTDSVNAQRFIEDQIEQYERRLGEAERKLADFKKENVGLMPSEGQDYYQRLQVAIDELDTVQADYNRVLRRRDELQKQIEGEEPTFGLLAAPDRPSSSSGSARTGDPVEAYEQELASLLLKYTEKHPQVIALRDRIAQMRKLGGGAPEEDEQPVYELDSDILNVNSLDLNPVYQSLKIAISEANADLSEVGEQVAAAKSRVEYLRKMVDTIPEIEAQLSRLNRDYEVNKTQYTALLKRLESARLSDEAEFRNEEIKFRIIEPPVIPNKPTSPNRPLLATVVLAGGLLCGAGLSFLLNLVNPVFNSVEDLRRALQLPVLGTVSSYGVPNQGPPERKGRRKFILAIVGLVVVYGGALIAWLASDSIQGALFGGGV